MPDEPLKPPAFGDLLARGQDALAQLAALGQQMARDLEARQSQLSRAQTELSQKQIQLTQAQTQLSQALARQRPLEQELEALRSAGQSWTAERERLLTEAEQLRQSHDALREDTQALQAAQESHEAQLAGLHEEREQLKELHAQVTNQAGRLAADWSARRQALTGDNQRLSAELEEARRTLGLGQEREKQWKAQVWKLQDEVRTLRGGAARVTLTPEQSYHLLSQLNAIIGFAQVLLDEAGSRATGAERQEFLQNIRDSGGQLAAYVNRLMGASAEQSGSGPADVGTALQAPPANAPAVLIAAPDPALRERIEPFLNEAGYRAEFASDLESALKIAVQLQPLAIMIDTELPPKGAQGLVDELLFEPRTKDIPVVLTVKNEEEPEGLSMGQYDFLRKPINRQQLLQIMAKYDLLAERRRASKMPTSVLVIDDDPKNTRLVQAMLRPFNIEVLLAHDGKAGIKLARARKPELIILDLMMPEVDGFAVVSELRSDPTTGKTPILIYTAKNLTSADRQLLRGNIQSIVRKGDFSKEQFLELVYRRGERRQSRSAADLAA